MPSALLLLSFNRPMCLLQTLQAIQEVGLERIYFWSDGPRPERIGERIAVNECRQMIRDFSAQGLEKRFLFAETNHGLRAGVNKAIDWFFEHESEGVILEDDCVPGEDFFPFCFEQLERFRLNERVMCVSGDNSAGIQLSSKASYSFVRYPLVWGWATWRRAWERHDKSLDFWRVVANHPRKLRALWPSIKERRMWKTALDGILRNSVPDSWATTWGFSIQVADGLCVIPRENLVTNVGFGAEATHTTYSEDPRAAVPACRLLPLRHPLFVERDIYAEQQIVGGKIYSSPSLFRELRKRTRRRLKLALSKARA